MNIIHNGNVAVNMDKMIVAVWKDEIPTEGNSLARRVVLFLGAGERVIERTFYGNEADSLWQYITAGRLSLDRGG